MKYKDFIKEKANISIESGFEVSRSDIHKLLFPHQNDTVRWCLKGGRRAIFAAFGLGKSFMQLEIMRQIQLKEGGKQLIIMPLGVRQEFKRDAEKLGMTLTFVRKSEEVKEDGLYITNYESVRDGKLDVNLFNATSLDEASVLRSFGSKTYQNFLTLFSQIKYRFVATATPSPNRTKELIHYAGYLGIMDTGQALTRWFKRDSTKANNLTLYPHKEDEFWLWLATWALFLQKPSDLGYSDYGYSLPKLNVFYHEVDVKDEILIDSKGQYVMFKDKGLSLEEASKQKRNSLNERIDKMVEILNGQPGDNFLLWHDQEIERHAIKKAVKESVDIYGSMDLEKREQRVLDFSDGKIQYFATKPVLSGSGCNFQRYCNNAVFLGIGFKFNDFIQSIHRIYRFLQEKECNIHIIYASTEKPILEVLKQKWENHDIMVEKMTGIIKKYGLSHIEMAEELKRSMGVERVEVSGDNFILAHNDCVEEVKLIEDNSIGLVHTSIPFCYDDKTEVLTKNGWRTFEELSNNIDYIATLSKDGSMEYQEPSKVIWEHYAGEMIDFTGKSFDMSVTPNHRMFTAKRSSDFSFDSFRYELAEDITKVYEEIERKTKQDGRIGRGYRFCSLPINGYIGKNPDRIDIPKLPDHISKGHGVEIYWIESKAFMKLAGWYLSEGHADCFKTTRSGGRISIGQDAEKNAKYYKEIEDLFNEIGLPPTTSKNQISVWCRNLSYFLQQEFGHLAVNKRIPRWVQDLDSSLLSILRDTMMRGDGAKDGNSYSSISEQLRNDFQEICIKTGWLATVNDTKVIYINTKRHFPELRKTPIRRRYSGMIGCATVPNSNMIIRRNGKVCVSGNSNHYEYSPSYNDFGHTTNNGHFWEQMDYLTPELYRILMPGRIYAVHVKDRILFGNVTGAGIPTVSPFHMETALHGMKHGFDYIGMITVVTDVVRENNQTYRLGWTEQCKDGSKMGVGSPEYIILLHKPQTDRSKGYADIPITKSKEQYSRARWQIDAHAFWRDSGNRLLTEDDFKSYDMKDICSTFKKLDMKKIYDYESHVKIGEHLDLTGKLPTSFMSLAPNSWCGDVWTDINRMDTLNSQQSKRAQNLHICPLQFGIIERIIQRYSNEGEWVFDPFSGLGSVPYKAVMMNRKGRGSELSKDYFLDSVKYLEMAEREKDIPDLFSMESLT